MHTTFESAVVSFKTSIFNPPPGRKSSRRQTAARDPVIPSCGQLRFGSHGPRWVQHPFFPPRNKAWLRDY